MREEMREEKQIKFMETFGTTQVSKTVVLCRLSLMLMFKSFAVRKSIIYLRTGNEHLIPFERLV